jgi:hypothetical protein
MRLLWLPLVLALLSFALSACAPGVYVRRLVPASSNLGSARKLALVQVRGSIIGVEKVIEVELAQGSTTQKT